MNDNVKRAVAEFIGPFALTFLGAGAIITQGGDIVAVALAHGLAIALMVAAAGHISGGVYNPALTIGLAITGKLPVGRAVLYIVVQLLGALAAALALGAIIPGGMADLAKATPDVGTGFTVGAALLAEIIATFFLMYVVFGTAVDERSIGKYVAPLAIGLTISIDILAVGAVSGAAMNPARWFGTAIASGHLNNAWVYWVGPIVGAAIAAVVFAYVHMAKEQVAVKK